MRYSATQNVLGLLLAYHWNMKAALYYFNNAQNKNSWILILVLLILFIRRSLPFGVGGGKITLSISRLLDEIETNSNGYPHPNFDDGHSNGSPGGTASCNRSGKSKMAASQFQKHICKQDSNGIPTVIPMCSGSSYRFNKLSMLYDQQLCSVTPVSKNISRCTFDGNFTKTTNT